MAKVIGKVAGYPAAHGTKSDARRFVVASGPGFTRPGEVDANGYLLSDNFDTEVLTTIPGTPLNSLIIMPEYRQYVHVFTVDARGRATGARRLTEL